MKRKASDQGSSEETDSKKTKISLSKTDAQARFRSGLFGENNRDSYQNSYTESSPYKHAVIHELIDDKLLRSVREEITNNVEFTPKETDIYKIHQSGDLANLDGLDDESLAKLPSLLLLRDAIYSDEFRNYVSEVTGCGPMSGRKTDMAINVYTPGCYLLCHDDVIGSRRVSYILYLTDPDHPWQPEWGGALRLYPVQEQKNASGEIAKTPSPDFTKTIPPAWNQLSFFAVQPGESFHDVEEVYHASSQEQLEKDGGRVRMAISGWFHIPQVGEEGFVEGEEDKNAKDSSLMQLQGNPAQYDTPQSKSIQVNKPSTSNADFDESDLEFLLRYLSPTYLTPDALDQVAEHFEEHSSISLANILSNKFSSRLKDEIIIQEADTLPEDLSSIEKSTPWTLAKPPHKHRYLFQRPIDADQLRTSQDESALTELLDTFLPSRAFRRWLQKATGCAVQSHDIVARRFRRGKDYTLATGHDAKTRLELNLGLTPTLGWGDTEEGEEEEEAEGGETPIPEDSSVDGLSKGKGKEVQKTKVRTSAQTKGDDNDAANDVGGHEVYMAGDDDDDANGDAAIYKSAGDDDNILFFQAAAWNKLTIVMSDAGVLKFVKYVSRKAKGDRWDISGVFEVAEEDEEDDEDDEEEPDLEEVDSNDQALSDSGSDDDSDLD